MARKKQKKQYVVEEGIFGVYPDFPVLINDKVVINSEEKPLHFHYYLEIGYCLDGVGIVSSNSKTYKMKKNDLTITAPNILHNVRCDEEGKVMKAAYLYIDLEDLLKLFPIGEVKTQFVFVKESLQDILYVEGDNHTDIRWIINEIIRLNDGKKNSYKMQITGLLYTLLLKIHDVCSKGTKKKTKTENLPIMPAINYIYNHYMEPIKVEQLAKECHFSEGYFRKVFQEMKGMSPMDYVNSIRIREACRALLNSTDNIHMIGEKCGYQSVTTFERNFKQRIGMLPSQWRESRKNPRLKDKNSHEIRRTYHQNQ